MKMTLRGVGLGTIVSTEERPLSGQVRLRVVRA